ncbi:hypothetical protein WAI453_011896 [Rhynchosporium graminicola]|uniref:Uncharacterized protein n=1 Tax=Rhynchosporium graminicola TaxID=2792576 RepID=A0A1E1KJ60_9HELO|nr:uncharacterized protein RCO7_11770 [Rhynchosporium commune]
MPLVSTALVLIWAILVPEAGSETKGTVIHVTGTPFTGYGLEFKRGYESALTRRVYHRIPLALVKEEHIQDVLQTRPDEVDINPRDALEVEAKKIDPPTASPEPLNPKVGKRCQDWTLEYIEWLISRGYLTSEVLAVLDTAKALETRS